MTRLKSSHSFLQINEKIVVKIAMNSGNMPASSKSQTTSMGQSTQSNNGCYGANEIQKPNRICRDFVQGYCRRKFCRVN